MYIDLKKIHVHVIKQKANNASLKMEHWFIAVVSHSMLSSTQVPLGQRHIRAKSPRASDVQTSVELNRAACDKGQPKCFFVFVVLYLLHVNTHICMYIYI